MLRFFSTPSPSSSLGNCFQSLYVLKTNMKGKTLLCLQLSEQKLEFPELFSEVLIFSPRPSLYRTQICSPLRTDREGTALKSWAALFSYLLKIKPKKFPAPVNSRLENGVKREALVPAAIERAMFGWCDGGSPDPAWREHSRCGCVLLL